MGGRERNRAPDGILRGINTDGLSIEAIERVADIQNRNVNGKMMRAAVPEFMDLGKDMLGAFNRMMAREDAEKQAALAAAPEEEQEEVAEGHFEYCTVCRAKLDVTDDLTNPQCPRCGAVRGPDGVWYEEREEMATRQPAPFPRETSGFTGNPDDVPTSSSNNPNDFP